MWVWVRVRVCAHSYSSGELTSFGGKKNARARSGTGWLKQSREARGTFSRVFGGDADQLLEGLSERAALACHGGH